MTCICKFCKLGHEMTPDGRRPPSGTVWCSMRKTPMGQNRNMTCFIPVVAEKSKRCQDCKWARMLKPSGETPALGKMWCERRHSETNKLRTMDCFE